MRRPQVNNYDQRTIFPDKIEVIEKRAPTDESVRLLNEMQEEATNNILCKISNERNNEFKWEAYFMRVASLDLVEASGLLIIKMVVNGHKYQKKVKVKSNIMTRLLHGEYHYYDIDKEVRTFLFAQLCFLLGSVLLKDQESLEKVLGDMAVSGMTNIDYTSLAEIEE